MQLGLPLLGGAVAVEPHLAEDGQVDAHLHGAADEELGRRAPHVEVCRLEDVAARPHQHHLDAARDDVITFRVAPSEENSLARHAT